MKSVIGIDGCRAGWSVAIIQGDAINVHLYTHLTDCLGELAKSSVNLIDIPIGLSEGTITREADPAARKLLSSAMSSSIFSTPGRAAVYACNYQEALAIQRSNYGKGFSIQAWNICPKIKEADQFLINNRQLLLRESHPELTFQFLNKNIPLLYKKKTKEGREERLAIMSKYCPTIEAAYIAASQKYLRKHMALDDIIDALGLAAAAHISLIHGLKGVCDDTKDAKGLIMNIYYVVP